MNKTRVEAFSDGVIAIIITIMVLEMKPPIGNQMAALRAVFPTFIAYVLSFVTVGIYWNNHHHMLHTVRYVNGAILWANLHLLFWLSLLPFVTAWSGQNRFSAVPVALYGLVLLMAGIAYYLLSQLLIRSHGRGSTLAVAVGKDSKGIFSVIMYAMAIPLAFFNNWLAFGTYVVVALIWLVPDRRIERMVNMK